MTEEVLNRFAEELQQDSKKTLQRFIALQSLSANTDAGTLKILRKKLSESPQPDNTALKKGLVILRSEDLRNQFEQLSMPVKVVLGQHDKLVPQQLDSYFSRLQNVDADIINDAGHAPFISHPKQTAETVSQFVQAHPL